MNTDRRRWWFWGWWGALAAAALAVRGFHLDARGLWADEFATLAAIRRGVWELVRERAKSGHLPAYFLTLKAWAAVAGQSEWALRAPSALMSVGALIYICLIARRAWGTRAALWAGAFFLIHQRAVWAAQEARPYAMVMLAAAAALHALLCALETDRRRWWAAWVAWTALGLATQAVYLFLLIGQLVVLFVWMRRRGIRLSRRWTRSLAVALIFTVVAYGALGYKSKRKFNRGESTPMALNFEHYHDGTMEVFFGQYRRVWPPAVKWLALPAVAAIMLAAARADRRRKRRDDPRRPPVFALTLAWTFSLILLMGLISTCVTNIVKAPRYFSPGVGGAALLMGLAVGGARGARPRWGFEFGLALWLALAAPTLALFTQPGDSLREAIRFVADERAEDETVLFRKFGRNSALMCDYYDLGVEPVGLKMGRDGRDALVATVRAAAADAPGLWLILYETDRVGTFALMNDALGERFRCVLDHPMRKAGVAHWRARRNADAEQQK